MKFCDKLDALMRARGLTQDALGKALGVTHRAVGGWLSGAKPHRRKAVELANFLDVSLEVLLDDSQKLPAHMLSRIPSVAGGIRLRSDEKTKPMTVSKEQSEHAATAKINQLREDELASLIQKLPSGVREKIISGVWDMIADFAFKYAHDAIDFEMGTTDWLVEAVKQPDDIKMSDDLLARAKSLRERYEKAQIAARRLKEADLTDLKIESVDEIKHRVFDEFRNQVEK